MKDKSFKTYMSKKRARICSDIKIIKEIKK